jgi:CheY-like chemotaxis protein
MTNALAQKTILVAEDSADTRAVLCRTLAYQGYRVVEAGDGGEAVEVAVRECPDLVVIDLNMPVMDGLAATEKIREMKERCGDMPVVVVTAFDTYGMREAASETGMRRAVEAISEGVGHKLATLEKRKA